MYTNQKSMIFLSCSSIVKVAGYCSPAGFKLIREVKVYERVQGWTLSSVQKTIPEIFFPFSIP